MGKKIIGLGFLLFANCVLALQFSPTSIVFSTNEGETQCERVIVDGDNYISVRDAWAPNGLDSWAVSSFNATANDLGIVIEYPREIESGIAEVCFKGSKSGEYHGALIFTQEKIGNSVVEFVVWLKADVRTIDEENETGETDGRNRGRYHGRYYDSNFGVEEISLQTQTTSVKEDKITLGWNNDERNDDWIIAISVTGAGIQILLIIFLVFLIYKARKQNEKL